MDQEDQTTQPTEDQNTDQMAAPAPAEAPEVTAPDAPAAEGEAAPAEGDAAPVAEDEHQEPAV